MSSSAGHSTPRCCFSWRPGLQLVFGVQKIVNLACGSFYALGAYFRHHRGWHGDQARHAAVLFLPVLIVAGPRHRSGRDCRSSVSCARFIAATRAISC
jgi:branched-subunit amino acid ABC-type transport system permease component